MEKFQANPDNDILEEPYKGPGPVVASAGYMSIGHIVTMLLGGIAAGIVGYFTSHKTVALEKSFLRIAEEYKAGPGKLKQIAGDLVSAIPKLSEWAVSHIPWTEKLSNSALLKERWQAITFAGGLGAATAFAGSTVWGLLKGGHESASGRHQFERAQSEIRYLREMNGDLERINDGLREKYVKAATSLPGHSEAEGDVAVAPEGEPAARTHAEKPTSAIAAQDGHAAHHHGKVHTHAQHEQTAHA
ncbi:MAG: hypothetical protein SFW64_04330 [Alphaproteobacteria bacterium]|nr:hypothetical protein [Alphaproteobacteria bacterium]